MKFKVIEVSSPDSTKCRVTIEDLNTGERWREDFGVRLDTCPGTRKFVEHVLGRSMTDEELCGFDMFNLVGLTYQRFECSVCGSKGFEPSTNETGCTFCDGTFSGNPPEVT